MAQNFDMEIAGEDGSGDKPESHNEHGEEEPVLLLVLNEDNSSDDEDSVHDVQDQSTRDLDGFVVCILFVDLFVSMAVSALFFPYLQLCHAIAWLAGEETLQNLPFDLINLSRRGIDDQVLLASVRQFFAEQEPSDSAAISWNDVSFFYQQMEGTHFEPMQLRHRFRNLSISVENYGYDLKSMSVLEQLAGRECFGFRWNRHFPGMLFSIEQCIRRIQMIFR